MAEFDLLEDVIQKFSGTVIMYDKKAFYIKAVCVDGANPGKFLLQGAAPNARSYKNINLHDPALNYRDFKIGYVNGGHYAAWWYRSPHKQWSQGLKSNQMKWRISAPGGHAHDNFGYSKPFINMLEDIYPNLEVVKKALIDQNTMAMAFHRDFALSYDDIHDDFVLEYHGSKIGASMDRDLKQFKIIPEARHLMEALKEARNVHE